jgi:hypothetical protein
MIAPGVNPGRHYPSHNSTDIGIQSSPIFIGNIPRVDTRGAIIIGPYRAVWDQ